MYRTVMFVYIYIRGVAVHKHDGLVHTSGFPVNFSFFSQYNFMVSVWFRYSSGGKLNIKLLFFIKQWFTEQIILSLNKFNT